MTAAIDGLDVFGLTKTSFLALRAPVTAHISLATYEVTPDVVRRAPAARHAYMRARVNRWLAELQRRAPDVQLEDPSEGAPRKRNPRALPTSVVVSASARDLLRLAAAPGVSHVYVTSIAGYRRRVRRTSAPAVDWFCVRARVAIAVEGDKRRSQMIEDRFVIVRATSFDDAVKRIAPRWKEYARPYMNPSGRVVRWRLEAITDVYQMHGDIDPAGTEVYSRLERRRPSRGKNG